MKRGLVAPALLLLMGVGPVTADYLFIKIDLNKISFSGAGQPGQPGAEGGMDPNMPPAFGNPQGQMGFNPQGQPGFQNPQGQMGFNPQAQGMMGGMANMGGEGQMFGPEFSSHVVLAFLELKSAGKPVPQQQSPVIEWDHRWGFKGRFPASPLITYTFVKKESVGKAFAKSFSKDVQEAKDPAQLARAADWALTRGLTKEFHNSMAALAKADPKNAAVANYQQLQVELKKTPSADDPATQGILSDLKGEGFRLAISEAGHYGILTRLREAPQNEAVLKRRLMRLEETYENFFNWFALQENAQQPPLPKHRLYVLLLEDKQDFHAKHAWWGGQPMVADSFTPRRDNLIVLSAKRLDENFAIFEKNVQILMTNARVSREELISGRIWDRPEYKNNVPGMAGVQTLALMQKAMEEEAERASISHAATRQLLFATGILPRLVNVPEWAQFGLASYFDAPYGALYSGVGLPSWTNLISFKYFRKNNKLGGSAYEALVRTISDRFFRDAQRAEEEFRDSPDKDKKDDKVKEQTDIARGAAWALSYYILQEKMLPQLTQYTEELNKLPRDLELDERALQACFAKAFNLGDVRDPHRLDPVKTRIFADAWFSSMLQVSLEVGDAEAVLTTYRYPPQRRPATQPNQFNVPGLAAPGVNPMPMPNPNPRP
jgi:hypothetical protein